MMTNLHLQLISNGVLIILLVAVLAFAWRLNLRLARLRDDQGEMKSLISGLNDATERAHSGISHLRTAATESRTALEEEREKARALADELILITQTGESLASRLEAGLIRKDSVVQPLPSRASRPPKASENGPSAIHANDEAAKPTRGLNGTPGQLAELSTSRRPRANGGTPSSISEADQSSLKRVLQGLR